MYRVSPFTYLVDAMLSVSLANAPAHCSSIEVSVFNPPSGQTCGQYLTPFMEFAGGSLSNPNATSGCEFCVITNTNTFLAQVNSFFDHRWRNFGLMWVFVVFNICAALFFYWLGRVPRNMKKSTAIRVQTEVASLSDSRSTARLSSLRLPVPELGGDLGLGAGDIEGKMRDRTSFDSRFLHLPFLETEVGASDDYFGIGTALRRASRSTHRASRITIGSGKESNRRSKSKSKRISRTATVRSLSRAIRAPL